MNLRHIKCILEHATLIKIKNNGDVNMIIYIAMIIFSPVTAVIPGIYATYLIIKNKMNVERNYLNIGLLILFAWSMIVAILNNSILSFIGTLMLLAYFSVGVMSQKYFDSKQKINKFLKYLTYFTVLTAINGITEKITFICLGKPEHRIISSYGNANMTGAWFASTILIILYLKSIVNDKKEDRLYTASMIIILIGLLLTESSGAIIAFVVSVSSFYILRYLKDFKKLVVALMCIAIVCLIFIVLGNKGQAHGLVNEVNNSFTSRYDIWVGSLKMISEKPLMGWGMLATLEKGNIYFSHNGNSIHSHNIYLTFLVTGGIIGLTIYLYIKYKILNTLYRLYKRKESFLPLLVSLNLMGIVQGLVDCPLYAPQLGMLFIITNAIALNLLNGKIGVKSKDKNKTKSNNIIDVEVKNIVV